MAILVQDSFNRTDNSTTIGNADTGQTWTLVSGSVGILSNQAYSSGTGGKVTIDSGQTNIKLSYKQVVYHSWNQLLWRYTNDSNTMRIEGANVQKRVAGTVTTLATISGGVTNNDILRVEVDGDTHTVYKNGVQVATFTESFNNTVTKQGFNLGTSSSRVDDYLVESLTSGTDVTVNSIVATITASAFSPTVDAQKQVTISSIVSNVDTTFVNPSVSSNANITISSIVSTVNTQAIPPNIIAESPNVSISSAVSSVSLNAVSPIISIDNDVVSVVLNAMISANAPIIEILNDVDYFEKVIRRTLSITTKYKADLNVNRSYKSTLDI